MRDRFFDQSLQGGLIDIPQALDIQACLARFVFPQLAQECIMPLEPAIQAINALPIQPAKFTPLPVSWQIVAGQGDQGMAPDWVPVVELRTGAWPGFDKALGSGYAAE